MARSLPLFCRHSEDERQAYSRFSLASIISHTTPMIAAMTTTATTAMMNIGKGDALTLIRESYADSRRRLIAATSSSGSTGLTR